MVTYENDIYHNSNDNFVEHSHVSTLPYCVCVNADVSIILYECKYIYGRNNLIKGICLSSIMMSILINCTIADRMHVWSQHVHIYRYYFKLLMHKVYLSDITNMHGLAV